MKTSQQIRDVDINFDDSIDENQSFSNEIPKEQRKLTTQAYDKSVSDLIRMMKDDEIKLDPEYQREYVWDNKKASLLIESILLNVPIPIIYVSQENDDTWNVIDGLQRLNSLKRFYERDFKLKGLEVLSELNKSDIKSLNPKAQRILNNGLLRVIVLSSDSNEEIKYDIFMRLNRGAIKLSEQELRNCLYRGEFNNLLKELRKNAKFLKILNIDKPHKRMADCEMILRFFALLENWDYKANKLINYKGKLKTFLNSYMSEKEKLSKSEISKLELKFNSTIDKIYDVFGNNAFRRINKKGETESLLNRALADCIFVSFSKIDGDKLKQNKNYIKDLLKNLLINDIDFNDSITKGTSDTKKIEYRIKKWTQELNKIVN